MGDRDDDAPGTFCRAELGTAHPEASASFYTGLFGWNAVDMGLAGGGDGDDLPTAGAGRV